MRTTTSQADAVFRDWIELIGKTDQLSEVSKKSICDNLMQNRRVMIVDIRNFFSDAVRTGTLTDASSYPIAILSRALPLVVLNTYSDIQNALDFCEAAAMNYDLHCYDSRVFSTTQQ